MARPRVENVYGPARRELYKQLRAFNQRAAGRDNYRPLAITLRQGRQMVGGLVGASFWNWMYIELLWISEQKRRKGLGRSLIKEAESEARKRGANNVMVATFSFQAPGFYKRLGYRQVAKLKNFPIGHDQIWLTKAL